MSKDNLLSTETSTRFATLARIQRAHGKDGELSVRLLHKTGNSLADVELLQLSSSILMTCSVWLVPPPFENRHLKAESIRVASDRLLVRFKGLTDRTNARELVGRDILVERSDVPAELLAEFDQLSFDYVDEDSFGLGLEVHSDNYGYLGKVTEVIVTGANLVWVVDGGTHGEVLLPVIDDCVLEVDETAGTVQVSVMEGLIDED
jgi:16S rRNA processing protein RimM